MLSPSAWKANKRVQFGYRLDYLIDTANAVIVDVAAMPCQSSRTWRKKMNAAAILKLKGSVVVTATANQSLLDIANLLAQYCIGSIVIVEDDDKVRGIISERDLIRAIGQAGSKVLNEPVHNFMTMDVVTARRTDTYDQLMSQMSTQEFRHMPVVERGRLVGIVSLGDLVKMQVVDAELESDTMHQHISTA